MFEQEFNLQDCVRILRKRRWIVIIVLFVGVVSVTLLTFHQTPIYQATARILIEKETPNILAFKEVLDLDTAAKDYYQTQYKILRSRTLARQVLEQFDMMRQSALQQSETQNFSIRQFLRQSFLQVMEKLGLDQTPDFSEADKATAREEHVIDKFLTRLIVTPIRDSRLVDVGVRSIDRKQTALFANTLVEMYIKQNRDNKLTATREAVSWLGQELETTREKLESSEAALQAYKEQHAIISLEDRQNIVMQKLSELNTAVNNAKIRRTEIEAEYKKIRQYDVKKLESTDRVINNPLIQELKVELSALDSQLSELQKKFRDKHPNVTALQSQIVSLQKRLEEEIKGILSSITNEYEVAKAQERDLSKMLAKQEQEALELDHKAIKYKELAREVDTNKRIYNTLLQREKETGINERLETSNIGIIDRAVVPTTPISPNKSRNMLLGLIMSLAIGSALAFFLEYLDDSIRTSDDIKHYLDLPFLGLIPMVTAQNGLKNGNGTRSQADQIVALNPKSNVSEAYRSLRTNVTFSLLNDHYLADTPGTVILVTSSNPSEGKSCVVANLGIAMAQSGSKTLIVDCDFRRPVMHKIFELKDIVHGFADVISSVKTYSLKKAVRRTKIRNLHVIPCGKIPKNPSELLGKRLTRVILDALAERYDKILIDSPPVNTVTDPVILSRLVDGVVFILRAGETKRDVARQARELLESVEAPILGGVLNSVNFEKDKYYYYKYYRYNSKYYQDNGKAHHEKRPHPASKDKDTP